MIKITNFKLTNIKLVKPIKILIKYILGLIKEYKLFFMYNIN